MRRFLAFCGRSGDPGEIELRAAADATDAAAAAAVVFFTGVVVVVVAVVVAAVPLADLRLRTRTT